MSKNLLVISVDVRETRVALIEDGIIAELHIERRGHTKLTGNVGDVYLGKVTRVLPGLQAAFVDIGLERAAFLHVEDLIRPADFEAYLAGGRKHAREAGGGEHVSGVEIDEDADAAEQAAIEVPSESSPVLALAAESSAELPTANDGATAETPEDPAPNDAGVLASSDGDECASSDDAVGAVADAVATSDVEAGEASALALSSEASSSPDAVADEPDAEPEFDEADDDDEDVDEPVDAAMDEGPEVVEKQAPPMVRSEADDDADLPGFTVHEPGEEPAPKAVAPRGDDRRRRGRRDRRGRDQGRGRSDGRDRGRPAKNERVEASPARSASVVPARISKSTPIREVVREGQEIIVQITKEPIGTKGARCSSHISLPGRYVVYLPTVDHVGVSKRIGSEKERARLREAIDGMRPPTGGLIVRTVAEGLTKKHLKQDVGYLVRLWGEIAKKREGVRAPTSLWGELDIVLKAARDLFTDEVERIVIDERVQFERLTHFVEMFMPERLKDIVFYTGSEPIFDEYGIEDEIGRALARKVPLPSGGHLIIDQAEALTAIDVNTGRFVGKGSADMEETILKTNLEAVQEIAYQLRFRNIGGLIILDLIDMEKAQSREKVRKALEEILSKDKAKTTLNRISELGLIEMTRKRTRESLGRLLHEPCFYCDGTGHLQSKETIAYEILREIRRKRHDLTGYTIAVNAHPAVAELLTGPEKSAVQEVENRYMRKIVITPRREYHIEQFDLQGR